MINKNTSEPESSTSARPAPAPTVTIIRAVVALIFVGVLGIVAAAVFAPANADLVTKILTFIGPAVIGLIALIKIQAVHVDVNSRLTQLVRATAAQKHAEGVLEGANASAAGRHDADTAAAHEAARVALLISEADRAASERITTAAAAAAEQITKAATAAAAVLAAAATAPSPAQSTVQIAVAGTEEKIEVMAPATIEVKAPE